MLMLKVEASVDPDARDGLLMLMPLLMLMLMPILGAC